MRRPGLFFSFIGVALLIAGNVSAQIFFNIANGDVTGLKNALNASNSDGKDDIIILATNGTYTLTGCPLASVTVPARASTVADAVTADKANAKITTAIFLTGVTITKKCASKE